jgi:hypothetical protein
MTKQYKNFSIKYFNMSSSNSNLSLFIILLENNKWLLHLTRQEDELTLFFECEIIYNFAKKNRPYKIEAIQEIDNILEIDFYVKKYMFEYGIENVRGGSYSDEYLPDYMVATLKHEISIHISTFENNVQYFKEIYEKYEKIKDKTLLQFEYNKMMKQIKHYKNTKYILDLIKYYTLTYDKTPSLIYDDDNYNTYETNTNVNKTILGDISWLKEKIFDWKKQYIRTSIQDCMNKINNNWVSIKIEYSKKDEQKYENIMNKLKMVNTIYQKIFQEDNSNKNDIYKTPNIIFDNFFYNNSNLPTLIQDNGLDNIIEFTISALEYYENMVYFTINRIDEYEYDMATYDVSFEKVSQYTIDILNKLINSQDL